MLEVKQLNLSRDIERMVILVICYITSLECYFWSRFTFVIKLHKWLPVHMAHCNIYQHYIDTCVHIVLYSYFFIFLISSPLPFNFNAVLTVMINNNY